MVAPFAVVVASVRVGLTPSAPLYHVSILRFMSAHVNTIILFFSLFVSTFRLTIWLAFAIFYLSGSHFHAA
jgi:hypothetical protein